MATIRKALAAVAEKLGLKKVQLAHARRRRKVNTKRAIGNHDKAQAASEAADVLRAQSAEIDYNDTADPAVSARLARIQRKTRRKDRVARRSHARAHKYSDRAQWWIRRIKEILVVIKRLEQTQAELEAEIEEWKKKHKLKVRGNRITGGTRKARFRLACLLSAKNCATGKRANFYSQPGSWTVDKCLTGEAWGERSDCSQWLTSVCRTAGLPDPNGTNWGWGYTGTQAEGHGGWKSVSRTAMVAKGFGYVIYGSGTGFHVEAYVGPGEKTIGHGSAPIDAGVIDLLGDGDYRCYTLG